MLSAWSDVALVALLDSVPDAVLGVDGDGIVRMANAQAAQLFGYARDELVGTAVDLLVPEPARAAHPAHRARYASAPVPRPMGVALELSARRKDGSEFTAGISLGIVDTPDGPVYSAAIRDVSERRAAHAERERLRDEADRAHRAREREHSHRLESLGLLAGGVAHDFNNVLAAILNYGECVARELRGISGDAATPRLARAHDDVEQLLLAAHRGAELTRQLLAFARREDVAPAAVDTNEVIEGLLPMLRRTVPTRVRIQAHLDPACAPVGADVSQLERVLVNLVVNARDALAGAGCISLRTRDVVVLPHGPDGVADLADAGDGGVDDTRRLEPGRYGRIDVVDDGAGMTAEVAERAFDPFFTTKPRGEGTGLGLATVFGIVTGAGGQVRLSSAPGEGTTSVVWLPALEHAPAGSPDPHLQIGTSR